MPPHSRSQRRRQAARQPKRPAGTSAEPISPATTSAPIAPLTTPEVGLPRAARPGRRAVTRPAPEPVDYSRDYVAVRRDLRWIAIWSVALFVAMIALRLSGLV